MRKQVIIAFGIFVIIVCVVTGLLLLAYSKPEDDPNSFYYPYDDMTFLGVESEEQACIDLELADEFNRLLYAVNTSDGKYTSSVISISKEHTQVLQRAVSGEYDHDLFNVAYIDCVKSDDRCVVTFICDLVEDHTLTKKEASKRYCNKIYCERENDMWSVKKVFIVP